MVVEQITKKLVKIGLTGNPNSGKTTLFNAITGAKQKVGNYPGVTIEKKEARINYKGYAFVIYDLPGIYSLTAYSPDEVVTRDFLLNEKPDIVIDVIDSTNLERNLYLCLQLQELSFPVIGALNVSDQAEYLGIEIDERVLSNILGIPFVKTVGTKSKGVFQLLDEVIDYLKTQSESSQRKINYGNEIEEEIEKIATLIEMDKDFSKKHPSRWIAVKLLEKDKNVLEKISSHSEFVKIKEVLAKSIKNIENHFGKHCEIVISEQRYAYIRGAVKESIKIVEKNYLPISEIVDKVLLDRFFSLPVFFFIMWAIFQLTFSIGKYPVLWLEKFFEWLSNYTAANISQGLMKSFVVEGLIGGIGGVFSFVPLIIILFTLLSILEDTGYIARAAFITDKFLHKIGLHGQSFMPMILGFGCSVPAIMATRTLKNKKDRTITALIIPFMSCGAKLPVYVLLTGAFFLKNQGNIVMLVYLLGVIFAAISSIIFNRFLFKNEECSFVMELPPYRLPTLRGIFWHVWTKTRSYLKKAGTLILAASIFLWFLTNFPVAQNNEDKTYILENSYAAKISKFFEPAIKPIGFNWKIGVALISGFSAKELVVSTLGVLYKSENENVSLTKALQNDKNFSPLVAFSLMLFVLVMPPCFATIATIKNEIGFNWVIFSVVYNLAFAWGLSFLVYNFGKLFFQI